MSNTAWFDADQGPQTKERDRDVEVVDFEPGAMVRHVEDDVSGLARVAREAGVRDYDAIRKEARRIGTELGAVLDAKGEGTRAYYRWATKNRDGSKGVIEGPTVDMMDALASTWGRLLYDLRIVEERGTRIHLVARVVDLVAVVAHARPFVISLRAAPGAFAGKHDEEERWRTMQMQAAESKAIRSVLEHVIPAWLIEEAMEAARDSAARARTGGRPLNEAAAKAIEALKGVAVPVELLVRWVGRPVAEWSAYDLQALRDIYTRVKRSEITVDALRVEAAAREADRTTEAGGDDPASSQSSSDPSRLDGLGLGKGTGGKASQSSSDKSKGKGGKAKDAGKDEPKSEKAADADAGKGAASSQSSSEPEPKAAEAPKPTVTADELRAAEADAGEGAVAAARGKLGIAMTVSANAIAAQSNARDYLVLLQGSAK